jgi:NAD(P) transhydrogenase
MQAYDLVVIGSGPGGQRAAIQAAKSGKRVAIIEKREAVGGVCINTGTIPSKTMREAVLHLSGFYYQNFYGANYRVKEVVTMQDLNYRVHRVIENEVAVIQAQLQRNGVELLHGAGSFLDAHRVQVENGNGRNELEAANVLIATGTKPAANAKVPVNGRTIINSDQILDMTQVPKTLIVVGGGVIGVEYACMFATLGVRVTMVEKRPRLLEFADTEMVEALTYNMRDRRVTMRLNEEVDSVEELPDGRVAAMLVSKKRLMGDALLYAVGRQGNVDGLNLAAAGVTADDRGRIHVDADYRTASDVLREHGFQLSDPGGMLQSSGVQRIEPPELMFRENGIGCRAKMARMNMLRQNEKEERFLAAQT